MKTKHLLLTGLVPMAVVAAPIVASADVSHSQRLIDRPRTNPASQITVGGDLGLNFYADPDGDGPTLKPEMSMGLGVFGRYGVSNELEVGVGYGFSLKDFEAKGDLGVEVAYGLMNSGNLQVAPQARVGYSFLEERIAPLSLGARVQFKLDDKLALFSSGNQLVITLDPTEVGAPPASTELREMYLALPVGIGFQQSDQLFAYASTTVASIEIKDSETGFLFADFIPLQVGAFFSPSNTMDLGAAFTFIDLKNEIADFDITLSARLHM